MRDPPDAAFLLALAREAEAQGGDAKLAARARAIAERERAAGDAPVERLRRALAERYGEGRIEDLLCRLAGEIRAGAADAPGPARAALRTLLWSMTVQKLAESNPDYLAAAEAHPPSPGRRNSPSSGPCVSLRDRGRPEASLGEGDA
ncbi:MAG TPA: DUF6285 domain-containing protein [Stellaceae bacterium]|nr:DUF6285 domain-containing protein [Stellaceae bacterium]